MKYICLKCGKIFDEDELVHGFDCQTGCRYCREYYDKAVKCGLCKELRAECECTCGVCEDCIEEIKNDATRNELLFACEKEKINQKVNLNAFAVELLGEEVINRIVLSYLKENYTEDMRKKVKPFLENDIDWFIEYKKEE